MFQGISCFPVWRLILKRSTTQRFEREMAPRWRFSTENGRTGLFPGHHCSRMSLRKGIHEKSGFSGCTMEERPGLCHGSDCNSKSVPGGAGLELIGRCQDEAQGSLACWEGEARAPGFVLGGGWCSGLPAQDELAAWPSEVF